ncbi:MAG: two-component sensor histidine kinase [Clostridia bacterium]|nr:two-component sensor histidine kinase [Clostridia bacterium]
MKATKEKKHISIKLHIFISMLGLSLGLIVILWLAQSFFLNGIYGYIKENDIKHASNNISYSINSPELDPFVEQMAVEYELCVRIFEFDSDQIIEKTEEGSHFFSDCVICSLTNAQELLNSWYDTTRAAGGYHTQVVDKSAFRDFIYEDAESTLSGSCLIATSLVEGANGNMHLVVLNTPLHPLDSTRKTLDIVLGIITLIAIVVSLVVSFLLSKMLSSPLEKMDKRAKALAESNYQLRFEEKGPKEVVDLAKTLNQTTEELASVENLRKELIANISHDLRTPLTMISGYSEVMRDIPGENTPENMQVIIDETARLSSLVNDLLNVSKLQSGTQAMNKSKMSLTRCLTDTVKRYDTLIEHKGYKIDLVYDKEVFIEADETRLLQVVYNLINNAINYTGPDQTVIVKQELMDDEVVRVSIIDSGEGINEKDLPLIWDRYYKVDKTHNRAVVGTGIGLSIVKNILLLHGSRFGVSSELGQGSTFWFEFKICKN